MSAPFEEAGPEIQLLAPNDTKRVKIAKLFTDKWRPQETWGKSFPAPSIARIYELNLLSRRPDYAECQQEWGDKPKFRPHNGPGNEVLRFYGTRLECGFASGVPCTSACCNTCCILRAGKFYLAKNGTASSCGLYGSGLYFLACSHTAKGYGLKNMHDRPPISANFAKHDAGNAIFVTSVLAGTAEIVASVTYNPNFPPSPMPAPDPTRFDSRVVNNSNGVDELVVFDEKQALPRYLIVFGPCDGEFAVAPPAPLRSDPALPTCALPNCTRPPWNGRAGEYCSRSCREKGLAVSPCDGEVAVAPPTCALPNCTRAPWNGRAGEYCSHSCRDKGLAASASNGYQSGPPSQSTDLWKQVSPMLQLVVQFIRTRTCPRGHLLAEFNTAYKRCNRCSQGQHNAAMDGCLQCGYQLCKKCQAATCPKGHGLEGFITALKHCSRCKQAQRDAEMDGCLKCSYQLCKGCQVPQVRADNLPVKHVGVRCDGCDAGAVEGVRHKCVACPDYDLCPACHDRREEVHPGHAFAAIPVPLSPDQLRQVMAQARQSAAAAGGPPPAPPSPTAPLVAGTVYCLGEALRRVSVDDYTQTFFESTAGAQFHFSRAEFVHKPNLLQMSSGYLETLEKRRESGIMFNPNYPDDPAKDTLVRRLCGLFRTAELTGRAGTRANVLLAWHGTTNPEAARSIADHGFAALSTTDPGYFGHGRYMTPEAEYACLYASEYPTRRTPNADGEWPVVLCACVVGIAYPITPCQEDFTGELPPTDARQCRFLGMPLQSCYDTHFVGVAGNDFLAVHPDHARFHELVFSQDAQLLPLAIVWFKKP